MMSNEDDDIRLGRCPRCGHVDPRQFREVPEFGGDVEWEPYEEESEIFGRCFKLKECSVCGLGGAPRSHLKGGYFKRDLLEVVDELPMMGRPCYHCGVRIPRFLDLGCEDASRIRSLVRSGQEDAAVEELVKSIGCPLEWARIWVTHPIGPRRPARVWNGPPCASCGRPLRTRMARQCCECGFDWHDPKNIRKLG
ncbi:MAG TPA: hypothetical protein VK661_11715 [Planctomycetota bacterium]|nr:hypothetical protein [Planctomycetota bacterium]